MVTPKGLIILDRDGVLNDTLPNPNEARRDSPLRVEDVVIFPWVPGALARLNDAGYELVIASNQPAFAKGKVPLDRLLAVHDVVVHEAQRGGAAIARSHVCFHRAEDDCGCRKPRPGLLLEALSHRGPELRSRSWMVGDRATDVLAGREVGVKTALVADADGIEREALAARGVQASFYGSDLNTFVDHLLRWAQDERG